MPSLHSHSEQLGESALRVPLGWFFLASIPMALDGWVDAVLGNYVAAGLVTLLVSVLVSGAAVGFLARRTRCRSPAFLLKSGLIVSLLAWGVHWAFFLNAQETLVSPGVAAYLLNPVNVARGVSHMLTIESYTWFSWSPPAFLRVLAWIVELVLWVALGGLWAARNALERTLFCEKCGVFAQPQPVDTFLSLTEDAALRESVMQAEFLDRELKVFRVSDRFPASFALCIKACQKCSETMGVHIALRTAAGGRVKMQDVSPLFSVTGDGQRRLKRIASLPLWDKQNQ